MWLTCNMFTHYVQTGSKNTQTCQVEVDPTPNSRN